MKATAAPSLERFWRAKAQRLVRRIRFAWWLDRFNLHAVVALFLAGGGVLLYRTVGQAEMAWTWALGVLACVVAGTSLTAWLAMRKNVVSADAGLVRLDDRLGLRNQLSSAASAVGSWPDQACYDESRLGLSWRWPVALGPSLMVLACLAAALWLPLPVAEGGTELPQGEPSAWGRVEEWLETLKEEKLFDEQALDQLESDVASLREQPMDSWFSHSSLEATDSLEAKLAQDISETAAHLAEAARQMQALQDFGAEMSEESRDQALRQLEEALSELQSSGLSLDQALQEQLKEFDPSQLAQGQAQSLSPEQIQSLRDQMKNGAQSLGGMGNLPSQAPSMESMGMTAGAGGTPGVGGPDGEAAPAPLTMGLEKDLKTDNREGVSNDDLSRLSVSDLLGLSQSEHDIDETAASSVSGGAISSRGRGGDAVWREGAMMPDEKALLQRYFK